MRLGIACLILGYVLSQFYRAFLTVLAADLGRDIGAGPDDLAIASGLWFLTFALMQIPVGEALDRFGPRRTVAVLLTLGGAGGAFLFARASGPGEVQFAMALIGAGCAPVLMASYYIFGRIYSPRVFGTLAGAVIGIGSLGNIAGSAPLAWFVTAIGWREALLWLAAVTLAVAAAVWALVRDPPGVFRPGGGRGSLADLLRIPGFWAILPLMAVAYAPAAAIRGLWAGPYLSDTFGLDTAGIGRATFYMGLAMVAGSFAYGPLDRLFGTRKWVVFAGNLAVAACLGLLVAAPPTGSAGAIVVLCALGFFGANFPAIMSHGRAFLPPHLMGRGVAFVNMFGIGGAGVLQFASGPYFRALGPGAAPAQLYAALFGFFLLPLVAGLVLYLFSRDSRA